MPAAWLRSGNGCWIGPGRVVKNSSSCDRFAVDRLLYHLSVSPHRDQFLLKGALLFILWFGAPHRPTRYVDLLGVGPSDAQRLSDVITALCTGAMQLVGGIALHRSLTVG